MWPHDMLALPGRGQQLSDPAASRSIAAECVRRVEVSLRSQKEMAAKKAGLVAIEEQGVVGPDGVARRLADSESGPPARVPYWAALVTYSG
eukprot:COSAG03_NODE_8945_length_758_cov_0.896813_1_plen_91_part_00